MEEELVEKPYEKSYKLGDFSKKAGANRMKTALKLVKHNHPLHKTPVSQAFPLFHRLSWDHFKRCDLKVEIA